MLLARSLGGTVVKRAMALMGFIVLVHRWIFRPIANDLSCTSLYWSRRFSFVLFSFYLPASSSSFLFRLALMKSSEAVV